MSEAKKRIVRGPYAVDIVQAFGGERYYYAVSDVLTSEIVSMGDAETFQKAEDEALWTIEELKGRKRSAEAS